MSQILTEKISRIMMEEEAAGARAAAEAVVVEAVVVDAEAVADKKINNYEKTHHSFSSGYHKLYMACGSISDI